MNVIVPPPAPMPNAPKQRVALWDNARFVLIVLVVVGHMVSSVRTQTPVAYGIYAFIYLFHMPAMIALSGLFAKADASPKVARSTLQLLATWLVWEGIWAGLHFFVEGRPIPESWLISPAWTLWFLVTLATMRILLPYIVRLRHPLLFSVALALIAGLSPAIGSQFSASRTLCFLPFFVAAWLGAQRGWFTRDWFLRPTRAVRSAAWGVFVLIAAVFLAMPALRNHWRIDTWLTWRDDYAWLFTRAPIGNWEPSDWWITALGGASIRLILILIAATMTLALLLIMVRGHSVITVWGSRTLYVYLLHGPLVWFARNTGAVDWFGSFGVPGVISIVALGVAVTVVLSLGWVSRLFRPVIEPRLEWVFARNSEAVASK